VAAVGPRHCWHQQHRRLDRAGGDAGGRGCAAPVIHRDAQRARRAVIRGLGQRRQLGIHVGQAAAHRQGAGAIADHDRHRRPGSGEQAAEAVTSTVIVSPAAMASPSVVAEPGSGAAKPTAVAIVAGDRMRGRLVDRDRQHGAGGLANANR